MVKFYAASVIYKWSWEQVAQVFWVRYPNPYSKHVLTEDVLARRVSGNCLYTRRLLTKTNPVPRWGERFIPGPRNVCIIEESVIDPKRHTITTYTRNIAMQHVMSVEEKCVYKVNPENCKWTLCEKSAWVSSAVFGFGAAIQAFGLDRFKKNAAKATRGFEFILERWFPHPQPVHSTEKLKDTARKMAEAAKAKASPMITARAQPS